MENSSEGPAIVGAAVLGAKALSKKSRSKRKGKRSKRLEKRAAKAEAKGKTGRAAVLRAKKEVVDTKKKNVDKKIASKDDKKKKKAKRVGMAVLTGGASEAHRAKKKAKKAVKAKKNEAKDAAKKAVRGAKAKVKETKAKIKGKVNQAATAVAGATAPPMYNDGPASYDRIVYGGNEGDKSKTHPGERDFPTGKSGKHHGTPMADSSRLTGAGSEGDPGLGRMSEGPAMRGYGKISYGNHQKPNMHKGNGKQVHGSPFNLGGSKLSKHFKK